MRIATFNVHHCAPPGWWARLRPVARLVSTLSPDVLAIQEVEIGTRRALRRNQPRRLADANGHQLVFTSTVTRDGGEYGIALTSRWPMTEVEVLDLPRERGWERRVAQIARVHPTGEPPFLMVGTHLQNGRGGPFGDSQALDQLEHLLARVDERARDDRLDTVVIAGDLNTDRAGRLLGDAGFSWAPSSPTFPSMRPRRHIDWIAARGAQPVAWSVPTAIVSDHRPLVVELERSELERAELGRSELERSEWSTPDKADSPL